MITSNLEAQIIENQEERRKKKEKGKNEKKREKKKKKETVRFFSHFSLPRASFLLLSSFFLFIGFPLLSFFPFQ